MSTIIPVYRDNHAALIQGSLGAYSGEYSPLKIYLDLLKTSEEDFEKFFEKATGFKPWGAQKHWLKRILRGENTVLVAPTGIGKTTLLTVYALYASSKGKRVLYVTPTKSLLAQTYKRMYQQAVKTGLDTSRLLCYDSSKSKKNREEVLEKIRNCQYNLLVVTNHFLLKNHALLATCTPDVVIVDDVDSLIKSEKGVVGLVKLLGFTDRAVELVKKRSSLLWKLMVSKVYGRNPEELIREYLEVDRELEEEISRTKSSQLIVASATGRSRGPASRILKDLLRIDLSGISIYGRNITDSYTLVENHNETASIIVNLVGKLGRGCIVYLSPHHPMKTVFNDLTGKVKSELEKHGFKVAEANAKSISLLVEGKIDVLIGYSTYYGSSVRGIDAPQQIKYVVFLGTPVFAVSIESFLAKINMLTRTLVEIASRRNDPALRKTAVELRKKTLTLSPSEKRIIKLCLTGKIPEDSIINIQKLAGLYQEVKEVYSETLELVKSILDEQGVLTLGTITLVKSNSRYEALIPDVMTYIQASGRASRLIGNRMTHGLSIIIEEKRLENLVRGLEEKLRSFNKELVFKHLGDIDLQGEKHLIESTRKTSSGDSLKYKSILLVVESPTKAKTIARFFGKPTARRIRDISVYTIPAKIDQEVIEFNIVATRGHIYDLTIDEKTGLYGVILGDTLVKPVYTTIRKCRICGTQFTDYDKCPRCNSPAYSDSKYVIDVLRKLASEVDEVYIATDPDMEGEKIAYDVYTSIKEVNTNIWRIELHEITLNELLKALGNKRWIDLNLVEAEMYRRILDRLVGFALSQKLQIVYSRRNLGAGRVQTPVLGLIIERYREHLANKCKRVVFKFKEPVDLSFTIYIDRKQEELLEKIKSATSLTLVKKAEEVVEVQPKPPLTTDELLVEASKIGLPVDVAMKTAQELFEAGLITYHRTDSTYISSVGLSIAREYLSKKNLLEYSRFSHWGQPGTHEAIRPVYPLDADELLQAIDEGLIPVVIPLTGLHLKLYSVIFKRFIASQMKPFKAVKARFTVKLGDLELGELEVLLDVLDDGFNKIQQVRLYRDLKGRNVIEVSIEKVEVSDSSRIALYTSGDVVLLMKKLGIGRPSTYAKIIASLRRHGYIIESKERKKLVPTKRGVEVYEYLKKYYPEFISVELTRRMEEVIDGISRGEIQGLLAVRGIVASLVTRGLVEAALVPPLYLNNYIGLRPPLDNLAAN